MIELGGEPAAGHSSDSGDTSSVLLSDAVASPLCWLNSLFGLSSSSTEMASASACSSSRSHATMRSFPVTTDDFRIADSIVRLKRRNLAERRLRGRRSYRPTRGPLILDLGAVGLANESQLRIKVAIDRTTKAEEEREWPHHASPHVSLCPGPHQHVNIAMLRLLRYSPFVRRERILQRMPDMQPPAHYECPFVSMQACALRPPFVRKPCLDSQLCCTMYK